MPFSLYPLLLVLMVQASPARDEPSVLIDRQEPTVERIMFDPRNPPSDMPPLDPGEAALCQFNFNCAVKLRYETRDESNSASQFEVSAHIRQIHVTLTLHNTIYLPHGAPPKIRAHEEGHRIINERVYEEAEKIARAAAMETLTQIWHGSGESPEAAAKAATDAAVKHLCETYLEGTANKAHRIGQIYDELTSHGRNIRLTEADAIRQSFARYEQEQRDLAGAAGASSR